VKRARQPEKEETMKVRGKRGKVSPRLSRRDRAAENCFKHSGTKTGKRGREREEKRVSVAEVF